MKKALVLPALAVLGGLAGFALRTWQLSTAVDPQSGIIQSDHPATLGLLLLSALLALGFLVLSRSVPLPEPDALPNPFYCPNSLYITAMSVSGLLLLAAGGLGLMNTFLDYQELQAQWVPDQPPVPFPAIAVLCGGLCLAAGASVLIFGRSNYRGLNASGWLIGSLPPGYLALLMLIDYYVAHSSDPLLLRYAWSLLGWVTTLVSLYAVSSCCYRKPAPRITLFFSGCAVYLQLLSLADRPESFQIMAIAALIFYLLAQSAALTQNCLAPRMPSGALDEPANNQENQNQNISFDAEK